MRRTAALSILAAIVMLIVFICRRPEATVPEASDSTPEEIALAKQCGRDAGLAVALLKEGSMDREGAILDIRARESAIRSAGFSVAADSFAAAAAAAMREKGVI